MLLWSTKQGVSDGDSFNQRALNSVESTPRPRPVGLKLETNKLCGDPDPQGSERVQRGVCANLGSWKCSQRGRGLGEPCLIQGSLILTCPLWLLPSHTLLCLSPPSSRLAALHPPAPLQGCFSLLASSQASGHRVPGGPQGAFSLFSYRP